MEVVGDRVEGLLPFGLARDTQRLGHPIVRELLHPGRHVLLVVHPAHPLALGRGIALGCQCLLGGTEIPDDRLARIETVGEGLLGRRPRPLLFDEPGGVLEATGLHHEDVDVVPGDATGDDELDGGVLELLERGERHPASADMCHPDPRDRAREGDPAEQEPSRRSGDAVGVPGVLVVHLEDRGDDLRLVAEPVGESRPKRPVREPRGEGREVRGAPLPAEEAPRDPPHRVHPLLDVDGQREEIEVLADPRRDGRHEAPRLSAGDDDGSVGRLGELPGLQRDRLRIELLLNALGLHTCASSLIHGVRTGRKRGGQFPVGNPG